MCGVGELMGRAGRQQLGRRTMTWHGSKYRFLDRDTHTFIPIGKTVMSMRH